MSEQARTQAARRAPTSSTRLLLALTLALLAIATASQPAAAAPATGPTRNADALARARAIHGELSARYRRMPGRKLVVTEASSTGVVESFTLVTGDLASTRIVTAGNGIYYAICPARAHCPFPARRLARPPADVLPRLLALELALRTFLETSATVVAVALPTSRFVVVIFEREELARDVDLHALATWLRANPGPSIPAWLRRLVVDLTRPRTFLPVGLEPTPSGRDAIAAVPLWPTATPRTSATIAGVGSRTR